MGLDSTLQGALLPLAYAPNMPIPDDTLPAAPVADWLVTLPPACVLDCKYAFVLTLDSDSSNVPTQYAYYASANLSVPGDWPNAWQTLRVGGGWSASSTVTADDYVASVAPTEASLFVRPLPGTLAPLAYSPYVVSQTGVVESGPGVWALAVTAPIPANTAVNITGGSVWISRGVWLVWTSPEGAPTPAGTVIVLSGFGPTSPQLRASVGTLVAGLSYAADESWTGVTAWTATAGGGQAFPITGTYTCCYTDQLPPELVPGLTTQAALWPCAPTMLDVTPCRLVDDWYGELFKLNNAPFKRWLGQSLPRYVFATGALPCSRLC